MAGGSLQGVDSNVVVGSVVFSIEPDTLSVEALFFPLARNLEMEFLLNSRSIIFPLT